MLTLLLVCSIAITMNIFDICFPLGIAWAIFSLLILIFEIYAIYVFHDFKNIKKRINSLKLRNREIDLYFDNFYDIHKEFEFREEYMDNLETIEKLKRRMKEVKFLLYFGGKHL